MEKSNLATPFTGARTFDPDRIAPVGLVLKLTVMLSATFISCPVESRNDTTTGNVSPGSAYGNRSTLSDNPATVPAVVRARPVSDVRPAGVADELQPWFASTATVAPSANRSLIRFTEIPPSNELVCWPGRGIWSQ